MIPSSLPFRNDLKRVIAVLALTAVFIGCGTKVFTGKREARGVWMSRFEYATERTRKDSAAGRALIRTAFERARKARFNMIFFQVRGNADAFYRSSVEPWSSMLTGTLGTDPGWDPLQVAVEEAHRLGLELHAWINTFPLWRGTTTPPETTPRPILLSHPEWVVCDSAGNAMKVEGTDYLWASPGNPGVREHVLQVVKEIVVNYDIDGIHFDYLRYPEGASIKGYSHDSVSVKRFADAESNPHRLSWEHWQREQINEFVFSAYNSLTSEKPWLKVSAAVIGKYMGSGWSSYYAVYQDPRSWMELGKIDFIVPMVYWERSHPTHPFVPLITQWEDRVAYDRYVVPGLSGGLQQRFGWRELSAEVNEVRKLGLPGVVFFSSGSLEKAWDVLGVEEFPYWSLPPAMPWKDSVPPPPPVGIEVVRDTGGVIVRWQSPAIDEPLSYIVYRSSSDGTFPKDVTSILWVTGRNETEFLDRHPPDGVVEYAVSALDRLFNESSLSPIMHISTLAATSQ